MLLEKQGLSRAARRGRRSIWCWSGSEPRSQGFKLAEQLRDAWPDLRLQINLGGGSFKTQFKRADKSGAQFALVLGDDEVARGVVAVKALAPGVGAGGMPRRTKSVNAWGHCWVCRRARGSGAVMAEDYLTDDEQLEHVKRLVGGIRPLDRSARVVDRSGVRVRLSLLRQSSRTSARCDAAAQFGDMTAALQQQRPRQGAPDRRRPDQGLSGSPYADQAQLVLARLDVDEGQDANAVAPLTEVMKHSKDAELRHIARLRLARVLIDQGKPDDALKTLADRPGRFRRALPRGARRCVSSPRRTSRKAPSEYKAALGEGAASSMDSALLALKIADLGVHGSAGARLRRPRRRRLSACPPRPARTRPNPDALIAPARPRGLLIVAPAAARTRTSNPRRSW